MYSLHSMGKKNQYFLFLDGCQKLKVANRPGFPSGWVEVTVCMYRFQLELIEYERSYVSLQKKIKGQWDSRVGWVQIEK